MCALPDVHASKTPSRPSSPAGSRTASPSVSSDGWPEQEASTAQTCELRLSHSMAVLTPERRGSFPVDADVPLGASPQALMQQLGEKLRKGSRASTPSKLGRDSSLPRLGSRGSSRGSNPEKLTKDPSLAQGKKTKSSGYVKPPRTPSRPPSRPGTCPGQQDVPAEYTAKERRFSRSATVTAVTAIVRSSSADRRSSRGDIEKKDLEVRLLEAVMHNDTNMIKVLIVMDRTEFKKHVNCMLLYAARAGSCEAFRVMCQYGGKPAEARDFQGKTVWDHAKRSPAPEEMLAAISQIISPSSSDSISSLFSNNKKEQSVTLSVANEVAEPGGPVEPPRPVVRRRTSKVLRRETL
eukprot:gnl/MRDRNA2_/MRDRNA2_102500_c0_seq1.p1 gnl/MRDRNA2_/MRDRNA2_102500_c0~~gnl/MRDRNA2_/MRDRNA2_102500_c0_seq1.p1  ORF type:complete len:351 (-),score=56.29 gnl/MRDRNA2_/MRDRNA2_102500_c0_seq1:319-1371(-)